MMIDKEMLSSPNSSTLDTDLDQNTTSNVTTDLSIKSIEDDVNNSDLSSGSDLVGHTTGVNLDQVENSNNVSESIVLKDKVNNTSIGNLNHPRCISQSSNPDHDVTSLPKKILRKHNTISTSSIIKHKTLCCKIFIIFAMCCIIGIFLIPIIAYYVNQTRNNAEVDDEYSHEINTLNAEVCYGVCYLVVTCIYPHYLFDLTYKL